MSGENLAFVDTETTGLDAERHEIWEVGLIVGEDERHWFLPVDLGRADAIALRIGGFHERHPNGLHTQVDSAMGPFVTELSDFAEDFANWTQGCHLVGAVISFDEERLRKLLRANGACPEWHYHIIDVEPLAIGHAMGTNPDWGSFTLPWKSDEVSRSVGVDPDQFDRHTALGDARWAKAIYDAVLGED
jgi:DNA polymerase III epsilon subunit-like protein